MDILFLLVPLSVLLALAVIGVLGWAVWSGQFEDLDSEGERIVMIGTDKTLEATDTRLIHIKPLQSTLPDTRP